MDAALPTRRGEALRGASAVGAHAVLLPLADLDAAAASLINPLSTSAVGAAAAVRVPEPSQASWASQ